MMIIWHKLVFFGLACTVFGALGGFAKAADPPTAAQALTLTPIQPLVEYTTPSKEEIALCTIRPEKEGNSTSWIVRNKQNEVLRRFADTNADNIVDQWCYFQNGVEVYRDIDSNYNGKADQYRWFNMAGTRWGVDNNEDGRIDDWKRISPHEVAEQVVFALRTRDPARFELLLLTGPELAELGLGTARQQNAATSLKDATAEFSALLAGQKIVTLQTRYVDFGSSRPGLLPAGSGGATKDVIVCDNGTALVQNGEKHEQLFLGTLVSVGDAWKLIDAPVIGSDHQRNEGGLLAQGMLPGSSGQGENAPSDEMQKLMAQLEQLDRESDSLAPERMAANVEQRAAILRKLAEVAPEQDREQWVRQLIDVLGAAIQSGSYPKGSEALASLRKDLEAAKAHDDLIAHAVFQGMWAQFSLDQRQPNADVPKLQEKWLADLQAFVEQYPKSADAAEGLLQLGMYQEFVGKSDEATKWYQQLVGNFPKARPSERAAGALRRLGLRGKPMSLRGNDIQGAAVDLAAAPYRGKAVLIHYWATWCEPCKADMVLLKDYYAKRGGRDFEIIAVCLDENPTAARRFLAENKYPWKNLYEPGGLDGRFANELGVMTLPLMILVDQRGLVANQNVHVAELEGELAKILRPSATGTAKSLRPRL